MKTQILISAPTIRNISLHFLILFSLFLLNVCTPHDKAGPGFLKTEAKTIVSAKGENVLLRGIGFGGWMLQEGYMLRIRQDGQQHKIWERIASLIGFEKTQEFYNVWYTNHVRKIDIDSLKSWGFNSVTLPMHYNLFTLPVEKEPEEGKQAWLSKGFEMTECLLHYSMAKWESEANKQKTITM